MQTNLVEPYIFAGNTLLGSTKEKVMWRLLPAFFMVFGEKAEVPIPQ